MNFSIDSMITPNSKSLSELQNQLHLKNQNKNSFLQNSAVWHRNFNGDRADINNNTKEEYKDPLLRWPLRGLAFTNDIGAAIMDIAPTLGTMLWIPALMYFGADIYDKYKSDEKEYNPNKKRAFKQAVFQALASVVMPIIVVHNGQKAASLIGKSSKSGMSLQLKEEIEKFTINHLKRRKLKDYEENINGFKTEFNEHLKQHLLDREKSFKTKNPLKLLSHWIFSSKHGEKMTDKMLKSIEEYTNKNIDEMFSIRTDLLNNKQPKELSGKLLKFYDNTKRNFAKDKNTIEGYVEDSIKALLKQRQRNRLFKIKLLKSLGGFIALGASIRFIDHFIEKHVIEKFVEPGLEKFEGGNWQKNVNFANFVKRGNSTLSGM